MTADLMWRHAMSDEGFSRLDIGARLIPTPLARACGINPSGRAGVLIGFGRQMKLRVLVDGTNRPQTYHAKFWKRASDGSPR